MNNNNSHYSQPRVYETKTSTVMAAASGNFRRKPRSRRSKAPTTGGTSVVSTLLRRTPTMPISRNVVGQLYYEKALLLSPAMGAPASYVFSANGLYDPNITSTGHQVMGFDQMMLWYEQATVVRSHIKVTFLGASTEPARVAVYLSPEPSPITAIDPLVENGLLKMDTVAAISATTGDGAHRIAEIELTCDIPKYFGKTRQEIIADPLMYTSASGNPSEQVYFIIAVWGFTGLASSVQFDVLLSYDTFYWEPKKLPLS